MRLRGETSKLGWAGETRMSMRGERSKLGWGWGEQQVN